MDILSLFKKLEDVQSANKKQLSERNAMEILNYIKNEENF